MEPQGPKSNLKTHQIFRTAPCRFFVIWSFDIWRIVTAPQLGTVRAKLSHSLPLSLSFDSLDLKAYNIVNVVALRLKANYL
jgi:hypothetical protein